MPLHPNLQLIPTPFFIQEIYCKFEKKGKMLSVKGIYDGKRIHLVEGKLPQKRYKVIVTFLEEVKDSGEDVRDFSSAGNGFEFWEDPREDLYQDYLTAK